MRAKIKSLFNEKVKKPVLDFLNEGISAKKLAWTISVGAVLGIFPLLGSTTVLCLLVAFLLRLNFPILMLASYLVYPLQFIFLLPFMKVGEQFLGTTSFELTLDEILKVMQQGFPMAFEVLGWATLKGMGAWAFFAPALIALLYFVLLPVFKVVERKIKIS
jgi:uncharacterized protein (DUF2062 family)